MNTIKIYMFSIIVLTLLATSCTSEMTRQDGSTFVLTLGEDTVIVETFTRTDSNIEGKILQRVPITRVADYRAKLTPEGTISMLDVTWSTPADNPDGPPSSSYTITIEDTVATITRKGTWGGTELDTTYTKSVPPGAIPQVNTTPFALSIFEQAVKQADFSDGDSVAQVPTIHPQRQQAAMATITKLSDNRFAWTRFGSLIVGTFNNQNELVSFDATQTTMKFTADEGEQVDFNRLASRFARMDTEGKGFGRMSSTEEIATTVDGSDIGIRYSRPMKRGRDIWGGLVPYNQVWRTGANAATSFTTSEDLMMGDTEIPAGSYTLFSTFTEDSATLIVNSQTGQWGTQYDKEQDFARIPMQSRSLDETVEQFTISVEDTEDGGILRLSWDQTAFEVPFEVDG